MTFKMRFDTISFTIYSFRHTPDNPYLWVRMKRQNTSKNTLDQPTITERVQTRLKKTLSLIKANFWGEVREGI